MPTLLAVLVVGLALIQFASRRSAGLPLIGLIVGSIVNELWSGALIGWLQQFDWAASNPALASWIIALMVTVPALALMFAGKKNTSRVVRLVGAVMLGLFAALLLVDKISQGSPVGVVDQTLMDSVLSLRPTIIGVVAVLATVDVLMQASAKRR